MIPFIFWKKREPLPRIEHNWGKSLIDATNKYAEKSREYEGRLSEFESNLSTDQYRMYMELRRVAQETQFIWQRIETLSSLKNDFYKTHESLL